MSFGRSIVSPVLVGRGEHLSALAGALDEARAGRGETVLLSGEAGIGKSRLAVEARARADASGFLCLEGRCFEPDRDLSFAPFLDLLRARFAGRSLEKLAGELGPAATGLVWLLPELTSLLPGLPHSAMLEPEAEKHRLFYALSGYFAGLATAQPLLICVEDLHWSDDTSLEFLSHLSRCVATHPILILLTYRSEEARPMMLVAG